MTEYERMLLAISSANLTANIENVSIVDLNTGGGIR